MDSHSNTINLVKNYYNLCKELRSGHRPTDNEIFTLAHFDIELAKNIIEEFGEDVGLKLGNVLVASLK